MRSQAQIGRKAPGATSSSMSGTSAILRSRSASSKCRSVTSRSRARPTSISSIAHVHRRHARSRDLGAMVHGRSTRASATRQACSDTTARMRNSISTRRGADDAVRVVGRPLRLKAATGSTREMEVAAPLPSGRFLKGSTRFGAGARWASLSSRRYVNGQRLRLGARRELAAAQFFGEERASSGPDERKTRAFSPMICPT